MNATPRAVQNDRPTPPRSPIRVVALVVLGALGGITGCPTQQFHAKDLANGDSGAVADDVSITALSPDSGPAAGGTTVTVSGSGFSTESFARVGAAACWSLSYVSPTELICVTPPGPVGAVDLAVSDPLSVAHATFTYEAPAGDSGSDSAGDSGADSGTDSAGDTATGDSTADTATSDSGRDSGGTDSGATPVPIDYCQIQYPCSMTASAGAESDPVYGWVYLAAVTPGVGQGPGVRLQLGIGGDGTDPATGAWTWTEMTYNTDKDGLSAGDLSNDEYAGTFIAPEASGAYDYAVRATADDGLSWLYCDQGGDTCGGLGSDDGYTPAEAGACTVP